MFSLLYLARKLSRLCVCLAVSAWDAEHIPFCSASQGKPSKGNGWSSTISSPRAGGSCLVSPNPSPKVPFEAQFCTCPGVPLAPGAQGESPACGDDRSVLRLGKPKSLMVNKGLIICVIFPNYQRKATTLSPPRGSSVKHFYPW